MNTDLVDVADKSSGTIKSKNQILMRDTNGEIITSAAIQQRKWFDNWKTIFTPPSDI